MPEEPVVVVGAGVAGLAAAIELAAGGRAVTVLERGPTPGGKLREIDIDGQRLDAGPTVLTLRGIFDELFAAAGTRLEEHLSLTPVSVLARHAWGPDARLDLHADPARSADAIGAFAGAAEARRFTDFLARSRRIYETLEPSFIRAPAPSIVQLVRHAGLRNLGALAAVSPFRSLWSTLGEHFHDPRLQQLFGRYATYLGSSPYEAPATLMLLAHVEQAGVWLVDGGMHRIAQVLARLATKLGATIRYESEARTIEIVRGECRGVILASGERVAASAVIVNADASALGDGSLGAVAASAAPVVAVAERSLSALTWNIVADTEGFPLSRHTVFFSSDYAREFEDIFRRDILPSEPTVYICAQDRDDLGRCTRTGPERLLCLVNAPPTGDRRPFTSAEIESCEQRTFTLLERAGLRIRRTPDRTAITTPADFSRLFPGSGGALYGRASHGWRASFRRPGVRTRTRGLYLAGGSIHPGPGVPMAALCGRLAAGALIADSGSTRR
jgi:1-hydroxycarotenoid 3,4-desaturase